MKRHMIIKMCVFISLRKVGEWSETVIRNGLK